MSGGYRRSDGDPAALRELAGRLWSWSSRWHPGELTWLCAEHPDARLAHWRHAGRVVAWAWARGTRLDLQLDPAHRGLLDELLAWSGAGTVRVLDAETWLVDELLARGLERRDDGPFFVHLRRSLDDLPPAAPLPAGYALRPADAAARAAVHSAAFSTTMSEAAYREVMRAPAYRAELDALIAGPDGSPAAAALAWLDERSGVAVLEPVGVHPEHRRRGLATAASLAALRAARDLGARDARVCARGDDGDPAPRAAYEALGFRAYARNLRLVRP